MKLSRLTPIAFACAAVLANSPFYAQANNQALTSNTQQVSQKQVTINLASNDLAKCLNVFAKQADIFISVDSNLTNNKYCQALKFTGSVELAFAQLLKNSGLSVKSIAANKYVLITKSSTHDIATLATAVVSNEDIKKGTSEDGYRTEEVSVIGPWKNRNLQQTPYSINVTSQSLLENLQATSTDQVFKINPLVQLAWPQAQNDSPYLYSRGFSLSGVFARNGVIRYGYNHGLSMEEVAQVEVLTGLSGFLYGPGNVGGMVNMNIKRPTDERLNSLTVGNASGKNLYAHGDFGGRLGDNNQFGYRVNLVAQDGETAIEHQELKRNFASVAFDWQITDDLLVQLDASKRDYHIEGYQTRWFIANNERPSAKTIQSDTLYGQPWSMQDVQTERAGMNVQWNISDNVTLRAAYIAEQNERYSTIIFSGLGDNGLYTQEGDTNKHAPQSIDAQGGYFFIDTGLMTGDISHKITMGVRYDTYKQARFGVGFSGHSEVEYFGPYSLANPIYVPEPSWVTQSLDKVAFNDNTNTSFTVGDDIRINEQWSALVGFTHSRLESNSYFSNSSYDESALTPSISVVYSPIPEVTIYTSYMESLEPGKVADDKYRGKVVSNAGQITQPLMSEQLELGIKTSFENIDLTAALFEIDKPFEFYKDMGEQYQLVQDGRQLHRGIEFTATGKLTEQLTIVGGFTLLDAEVEATDGGVGKQPRELAEQLFKLYSEYAIAAVDGLFVNASASYTGDSYADTQNTDKLNNYTLFDVGARYAFDVSDTPITLRLNVSNLTKEQYWVNRSAVGDGRRVSFSANINF